MDNIDAATAVIGALVALGGIYLTYRKMIRDAQKAAIDTQSSYRVAELEDQQTFRAQLIKRDSELSQRITNLNTEVIELRTSLKECERRHAKAEQHFTDCDKELEILKARLKDR